MKDDSIYLKHILDAIDAIGGYTASVSHDQFVSNGMMVDAVMRELEIVGEAARNVSDDTRHKAPQVEWSQIIGLRNRLIHAYFQIDIEVVWEIVCNDLLVLRHQIEALLSS
jgi:uncharacterized protein with HEPN domain